MIIHDIEAAYYTPIGCTLYVFTSEPPKKSYCIMNCSDVLTAYMLLEQLITTGIEETRLRKSIWTRDEVDRLNIKRESLVYGRYTPLNIEPILDKLPK